MIELASLRDCRFVVKLGGEVLLNTAGLQALAADVAAMASHGLQVVIVHGGGPQADTLAQRLGHRVRKVAGRRVTDDDALEVAKMVYSGSTNVELLATLTRQGARGVGLSGVDADLITVTKRPPKLVRDAVTGAEQWVDFGHVGDVQAVDPFILHLLLGAGCVPVVASLAADREGNLYNVNADTIAQSIAVALAADALYLVTNVPGILLDPSDPASLLPRCTPEQAAALMESGVISGGMLPKVQNCLDALQSGVRAVRIIDGSKPESLLLQSLLGTGAGTELVA